MKTLLISFSILILTNSFAQKVNFTNFYSKQNGYNVKIESNYKYSFDKIPQGVQENFIVFSEDSSVKYLMNVIKVKANGIIYDSLLTEKYILSFSKNNQSNIIEVGEVMYESFKAVRYLRQIITPQRVFLCCTISTIIRDDLFVVSFNTTENGFIEFESVFIDSVNSIRLINAPTSVGAFNITKGVRPR